MKTFFDDIPIVGILRGFSIQQAVNCLTAVERGGLKNVEITMNSPSAAEQIRAASQRGGLCVGAGTVLDLKGLDSALAAGASFIVTPAINREVIAECVRQKVPIFPGAMTPTEIVAAWELGAIMVKVFPAETLRPKYIRAVKAPLPQIKLMPTGGVDLKTLAEFKKAGADGFGVGSPLFDRGRIEAGDWTWLEAQARAFVTAFRAA